MKFLIITINIGLQSAINNISNLIVQWGHCVFNSSGVSITFPITFTNHVSITTGGFSDDIFTKSLNINTNSNHKNGFIGKATTDGGTPINNYHSWIAIGN